MAIGIVHCALPDNAVATYSLGQSAIRGENLTAVGCGRKFLKNKHPGLRICSGQPILQLPPSGGVVVEAIEGGIRLAIPLDKENRVQFSDFSAVSEHSFVIDVALLVSHTFFQCLGKQGSSQN